jgi:hypothetical protein
MVRVTMWTSPRPRTVPRTRPAAAPTPPIQVASRRTPARTSRRVTPRARKPPTISRRWTTENVMAL